MVTRFTDEKIQAASNNDFIVRQRVPMVIQISLVFVAVFAIVFFLALTQQTNASPGLFGTLLAFLIGGLGWFTVTLVQRNRDLVLATEFQNAMLASAAQLSTRFCLITRRDGTIVYIDTGFQKVFPQFMQSDSRSVDSMMLAAGVPEAILRQISSILGGEASGRFMVPFKSHTGEPMPMVVTIDLLPRPQGFYLFRGRDYIEKRADKSDDSDAQAHLSNLLRHAVQDITAPMIITDNEGRVLFFSQAITKLLGYRDDEPLPTLEHLCYQFEGLAVGVFPASRYHGNLALQRKNRSLVTMPVIFQDVPGTTGGMMLMLGGQSAEQPAGAEAQSGGLFNDFVSSSPIAVARVDSDGTVIECNDPLRQLSKRKLENAGWKFFEIVKEEHRTDVLHRFEELRAGKSQPGRPLDVALSTDEPTTASLFLSRLGADSHEIIAQFIDTTEQKNLEHRFAHSQKMQAVGQLAGGVAHDFNNLLTAMIGFCDLLLIRHPAGDQSFADIMQIKQNANRAANLVRQLLAFSRRQTLQPKMLDITDVLAELSNLVRRLIGENIELKVVHGRDLGMVKADQGQLEQVFINLAVNARDAMHNGGKLTIQTSHVVVDRTHPIGRDLVQPLEDEPIVHGDYVLVEVIDTGTGIPRKLLQKIFEPFFSTKEVGSGTGLGLATVYGIIKQTGGYIFVTSKEGAGTTFSLFFKRYKYEENKVLPEQVERPSGADDLTGNGTILLVEDETPVRTFAARALRNKGYTVLEADCGENAIEVMEAQGNEVDVIISDVIMPGMNGPSMIEAVAPKFPRVRVIFISGYAEDIFVKNYGSEREFNFLPKPFTLKQLASKVKEVMSK